MDTPSEDRGLSLTLSWGASGARRRRSVSLGSALRVALALSLCAGCYEVGRWSQRLEALDAVRPDSRVVIVERGGDKAVRGEGAGLAPGGTIGEKDVITPLNVRDPSALVMGPSEPAPPLPPPPEVQASPAPDLPEALPRARVYKKVKDIKPTRRF